MLIELGCPLLGREQFVSSADVAAGIYEPASRADSGLDPCGRGNRAR